MERVVVAMSGGVDSSVAAALLQRQGYDVIGATLLVWSPPGVEMAYSEGCCGLSAAEDARRVCDRLGIRHYTLDFRDLFYDAIVQDYVREYLGGRTPNPCVRCNELVKFSALMERARALGAERMATGHYARVRYDSARDRWLLLRAADRRKDQSYALYRLSQQQLARTLFPLGDLEKGEVRRIAAELELPTAGKPDSQETCFVPGNDYPALLQLLAPESIVPGEFRSPDGRVLGRHPGVAYYTVGQRRRINVGSPEPLYVSGLDPDASVVTVAPAAHPSLARTEATAERVRLVGMTEDEAAESAARGEEIRVGVKIRYNANEQAAAIACEGVGDALRLRVRFDAPQRAVTPGQSLVCFSGEEVVCGGVIAG